MIALFALDLLALLMITSWAVLHARRMLRLSSRDAHELAAKLDHPRPQSARDWPELRVDAVIEDPHNANTVLVVVRWPAHPASRSLLVLTTAASEQRARRLLADWRDSDASVSPTRVGDRGVVLRRRRAPEQLRAVLVHESSVA